MLLNLGTNALRVTSKKGGEIQIKTGIFTKEDKTFLRISVIDNGPGIDKQDLPKLFKPFVKIERHCDTKQKGLGLYICKLICTSLGGDITVESGVFGSAFTFWIPVKIIEEYDIGLPSSRRIADVNEVSNEDVIFKTKASLSQKEVMRRKPKNKIED